MSHKPTLTIDVAYYQNLLDDTDLTDEQKKEVIETLWSIVCEFVMIGFNVHPVQQAQQSCAKDAHLESPDTQAESSTLDSGLGSMVQAFVAACERGNADMNME